MLLPSLGTIFDYWLTFTVDAFTSQFEATVHGVGKAGEKLPEREMRANDIWSGKERNSNFRGQCYYG